MTQCIDTSRMRYLTSMQKIASSLELIAFDNARDLGPDHTTELLEIVRRLNTFIDRCARRTTLGAEFRPRLN